MLTGASANTEEGARLDIAANGFRGASGFTVGHERAKVRAYEQRVREVEHGSFTPLVMSLTGGAGPAVTTCFKRLASLLSEKWDQSYSSTLAWLSGTLSFALLRSSIQCLQGARSAAGRPSRNVLLPVDLVLTEAGFDI